MLLFLILFNVWQCNQTAHRQMQILKLSKVFWASRWFHKVRPLADVGLFSKCEFLWKLVHNQLHPRFCFSLVFSQPLFLGWLCEFQFWLYQMFLHQWFCREYINLFSFHVASNLTLVWKYVSLFLLLIFRHHHFSFPTLLISFPFSLGCQSFTETCFTINLYLKVQIIWLALDILNSQRVNLDGHSH